MNRILRRAPTMRAVQSLLSPSPLCLTRRAAVLLPVLLLHVVLLWLLTQSRPERADLNSAPMRQPMVLRWIEAVTAAPPLPTAPAKPAPDTAQIQAPRVVSSAITRAASSTVSVSPPLEAGAAAITATAAITPAPTQATATTATTASSPPTTAPLDLTLRRGASSPPSARSPASLTTQDSRSNSERVNFGDKLAEALGSDERRTEENLGDGRIRFRSGADCVIAVESRAGQLDPMSQTTRPAPRGTKSCK